MKSNMSVKGRIVTLMFVFSKEEASLMYGAKSETIIGVRYIMQFKMKDEEEASKMLKRKDIFMSIPFAMAGAIGLKREIGQTAEKMMKEEYGNDKNGN